MQDQGRETVVETALMVRPAPAGGALFGGATVYDEAPLWLAWKTAQEAWLGSLRLDNGEPSMNTRRAYELAMKQFFDFAQVAPWQVSSALVQGWIKGMRDRKITEATINLKLAAMSSFYSFVQTGYAMQTPDGREVSLWPADRAQPFGVVKRTKVTPYGKARFPTTEELRAMLALCNTQTVQGKRDFALLYTIAQTCRRSSEVTNLRWGNLEELESGDWAFEYLYKGGKKRKAVLNNLAMQAIRAYLAADGRPVESLTPEDYVFVPLDPDKIKRLNPLASAEANRPISNHTANGILRKYAKRAGVALAKAHIHALRHAGARLRVENAKASGGRVDLGEIRDLLGHSSLAVTDIYLRTVHEDPEDPGGQAAAEALLPRGKRRRQRKPAGEQSKLL